jgi:hypothetical protein
MTIGGINKKFGWLWLLIAPVMGMVITSSFQGGGYAYILEGGAGVADTFQRMGNRMFHVHVGILALLNIIYGTAIDETKLGEGTKRLGAYLAVVGAILVSLSFFVSIMPSISTIGFPSRVIGFVALLSAILIVLAGKFTE